MLEKNTVISQIQVTESNIVHVRTSTRITDNGATLSETYHRHTIAPGEDFSQEDSKVQAVCASVHTPESIARHQAIIAANMR